MGKAEKAVLGLTALLISYANDERIPKDVRKELLNRSAEVLREANEA